MEELNQLIVEAAKRLGYVLKEEQKTVITSFVLGQDVFVVLPTGFGKSLCFACLPIIFDRMRDDGLSSVVMIVTPLTAIIKDQVHAFRRKGLTAGYICGDDDNDKMKQDVRAAKFQLLYFTPEALLINTKWRQLICTASYQKRIRGLIIDEAHTIKKWGTTFREALSRIGELRSLIPEKTQVMALTATATRSLRLELTDTIGMKNPMTVVLPPCKCNLKYAVSRYDSVEDTFTSLLEMLRKERITFPRTIIYCRKMEDCANLYLFFQNNLGKDFTEPLGMPSLSQFRLVEMFTSCTDIDIKNKIISSFTKQSSLRIVCATIAFGMGVDCPDVRSVIHLGPPDDVESYIQETGRAGRDGLPSDAILLLKSQHLHYVNNDMKIYCQSTTDYFIIWKDMTLIFIEYLTMIAVIYVRQNNNHYKI